MGNSQYHSFTLLHFKVRGISQAPMNSRSTFGSRLLRPPSRRVELGSQHRQRVGKKFLILRILILRFLILRMVLPGFN